MACRELSEGVRKGQKGSDTFDNFIIFDILIFEELVFDFLTRSSEASQTWFFSAAPATAGPSVKPSSAAWRPGSTELLQEVNGVLTRNKIFCRPT
jgi:hypothetical protein